MKFKPKDQICLIQTNIFLRLDIEQCYVINIQYYLHNVNELG